MPIRDEAFKPGVYSHRKGGIYFALGLFTHHDTRKPMVVYLSAEKGEPTARPLRGWSTIPADGLPQDPDGWLDQVRLSDDTGELTHQDRFVYVRPMTAEEYGRAIGQILAALLPDFEGA